MAQTTFSSGQLTQYTEGQITQRFNHADVQSRAVDDTDGVEFGRVLAWANSARTTVQNVYSDTAQLSLTAALVAGDVVDLNIVLDGVTYALTSTTYATSHAATMAAIETKIEAVNGGGILTATVSTNDINITAANGHDVYITGELVTNGGAGTAVASATNTKDSATFAGPSVQEERAPNEAGDVIIGDGASVGVGRKCYIALPTLATLNPGDAVYVVCAGANRGKLTNAAGVDGSLAVAWTALEVIQGVTGAGIIEVCINKGA